jgi:nucleotide-binding universal stress UspA family protein
MNKTVKTQIIQQILVAFDASPHSLTALEAAAELARELQAELIAMFVEDVNLLKLAGLPFAQEIHYPKATTQKLDRFQMENQLRQQAGRARDIVRQIAERDSLAWTFRVARGVVAAELLAAALEADLLVLGRISRQLAHSPLGSTARMAIAQSKPPVLLLGSEFDLGQPILVLYDGSPVARTALNVAVELAQNSGYLGVLIWGSKDNGRQYQSDIIGQLMDQNLVVNFRHLSNNDDVAGLIQRSDAGLLVIGETETPFIRNTLQTVLEKTDYPILVVR